MKQPEQMPESFRAKLDAALARPLMLDQRALDSVRAGSFAPRADMGDAPEKKREAYEVLENGVAIVDIQGALAQRAWSCWMFSGDGYDAIESRVREALADKRVSAVVMRMDSPGGEVAGCFEAVRGIRGAAASASKPVVAFADQMACSAAYALACAASHIVVPDTGAVGSIGVIVALAEQSEALKAEGISVAVITSGEAKADGHPAIPLANDARARIQAEIDYLADIFADEVSAARPLTASAVRDLEARVFYGQKAVDAGIADRVGNFLDAIALAESLANERTNARRGIAAARNRRTGMETVAKALGLPVDASEADVLASVVALKTDADTAAKTVEALSRDVAEANAKAKAAHEREEATERAAIIEAAKSDGQWSASIDGFLGRLAVADLREWKANAPRVVPSGEIKPPADAPTADADLSVDIAAIAAKGWSAMTADEKHAVITKHPGLAARLRKQSA